MRFLTILPVLLLSGAVYAQQYDEIEFHQASELFTWCQDEARAYFAGQGISTYQWRGRHYDQGNTFFVEGKIRANGSDVPVNCRVARGARERYAVVEIGETP